MTRQSGTAGAYRSKGNGMPQSHGSQLSALQRPADDDVRDVSLDGFAEARRANKKRGLKGACGNESPLHSSEQ
jgi:hypothetical protein